MAWTLDQMHLSQTVGPLKEGKQERMQEAWNLIENLTDAPQNRET